MRGMNICRKGQQAAWRGKTQSAGIPVCGTADSSEQEVETQVLTASCSIVSSELKEDTLW